MKIEIRRWDNDEIIVCGEYESIKDCLERNKGKSFYRADLRSANLSSANLSSANLSSANLSSADLCSANLNYADLCSANLNSADLRYANLSFANLSFANLNSADLRYANLNYADLRYANLNYAKIKEPTIFTDLYYFLTLQPDITMRAWKHLKDGKSPYQHKEYEVGEEYTFNDLNKDKFETCGKGGNIATLNWCLKDSAEADEFIEVEVNTKDLIVPYFSDGKFRVSKFKVLRKINRKEAVELIEKTMA